VVKPTLSIVVQPIQAISETAAAILLRRLKADRTGFPAIHRLKTELLMGESVKNLA
jgi:DNA-binding LacI/PurR family transcriptional regulator